MTLLELGAKLREAREARGDTVEDVAAALKINTKLLYSLEAGDEASLPQAVFVRNFIRAYGQYLGFSAEEMRQDAYSAFSSSSSLPTTPPFEVVEESSLPVHYHKLIVVGVLLALLCAGLFTIYAHIDLLQESISQVLQQSPLSAKDNPLSEGESAHPVIDVPLEAEASSPSAQSAMVQEEQTQASNVVTDNKEQTNSSLATDQQQAATLATPQKTVEVLAPAAEKPAAVATQEGNKLVIFGVARCWIRYRVDAEKSVDYTLQKGGTLALAFKDRLEIQFGNVGGVRMTYNDKDLPVLANKSTYKMVFPQAAAE